MADEKAGLRPARPQPDAPWILAHRGLSGLYPENTLAAFRAALAGAGSDSGAEAGRRTGANPDKNKKPSGASVGTDTGADKGAGSGRVQGLELDIVFSKDDVAMVIHDETLARTTDGKGRVEDFTCAELQQLDAGSWFSPEYKGERIPTLQQVLQEFGPSAVINLEIKPQLKPAYREQMRLGAAGDDKADILNASQPTSDTAVPDAANLDMSQFNTVAIASYAKTQTARQTSPAAAPVNYEDYFEPYAERHLRAIVQLVKQHQLSRSVIVSSFAHRALAALRQISPDIRLSLLYDYLPEIGDAAARLRRLKGYGLHLRADLVTREWLATWQDYWRGHTAPPVLCWTLDEPERARQLFGWGVSGIFTNRPDLY